MDGGTLGQASDMLPGPWVFLGRGHGRWGQTSILLCPPRPPQSPPPLLSGIPPPPCHCPSSARQPQCFGLRASIRLRWWETGRGPAPGPRGPVAGGSRPPERSSGYSEERKPAHPPAAPSLTNTRRTPGVPQQQSLQDLGLIPSTRAGGQAKDLVSFLQMPRPWPEPQGAE